MVDLQLPPPERELLQGPRVLIRESRWKEGQCAAGLPFAPIRVFKRGENLASQLDGNDIFLFFDDPSGIAQLVGPKIQDIKEIINSVVQKGLGVIYAGVNTDNKANLQEFHPENVEQILSTSVNGAESSIKAALAL